MTDQLKKHALYIVFFLSFIWSLFAIGYISAVTFMDVPLANVRVVDQVLGFIMGTVVASVLNFWTGSSLGSKTKEDKPEKETK